MSETYEQTNLIALNEAKENINLEVQKIAADIISSNSNDDMKNLVQNYQEVNICY